MTHSASPLDPSPIAKALFDAVRAGDAPRAAQCIAQVAPEIERQIRGVVARNASLLARNPALTADDVVQEVFARLLRSPPDGVPDNPVAAMLAWVRTTAVRFLLDQADRPKTVSIEANGAEDSQMTESDLGPAARDDPSERAELRSELDHVRRLLAGNYPRGLELLEAECSHPDEPDSVLAEVLRTSVANVQQIRHRRVAVLAAFVSGLTPGRRP